MLRTLKTTLCAFGAIATLAGASLGQEAVGFDPMAIDWVLPGKFEEAFDRAEREQRILLIKGVSFGIDDVGAVCATKGDW